MFHISLLLVPEDKINILPHCNYKTEECKNKSKKRCVVVEGMKKYKVFRSVLDWTNVNLT